MPLASTDGPAAQPRLSPPLSPASADGLRRLTSSGNLAPTRDARGRSPRNSVHGGHLGIATARGTLSPAASIPSSPTSVHSTSSAIFERDVEPILTHSLSSFSSDGSLPIQPATPVNQHLIPRQKAHEAIDQSVPSVLDSAATILATTDGHDFIADSVAIVSPAAPSVASSLFATTSSSPLRSRSPSPAMSSSLSASMFGANRAGSVSPPMRPTLSSEVTAMQVPRSMSMNSTTSDDSRLLSAPASPSVPQSALDHTTPVPGAAFALPSKSSPPRSPDLGQGTAPVAIPRARAPPSPSRAAARLSFISYADLVTSVPSSTQALSSLTSGASTDAPPPHLPSVSLPGDAGSTASSVRNVSGGSHFMPGGHGHGMTGPGSSHAARGQRESAILLNDEGGEWEREGLGMGLEERLEAIVGGVGKGATPVTGTA